MWIQKSLTTNLQSIEITHLAVLWWRVQWLMSTIYQIKFIDQLQSPRLVNRLVPTAGWPKQYFQNSGLQWLSLLHQSMISVLPQLYMHVFLLVGWHQWPPLGPASWPISPPNSPVSSASNQAIFICTFHPPFAIQQFPGPPLERSAAKNNPFAARKCCFERLEFHGQSISMFALRW